MTSTAELICVHERVFINRIVSGYHLFHSIRVLWNWATLHYLCHTPLRTQSPNKITVMTFVDSYIYMP